MTGEADFDQVAAVLRADARDAGTFLEVLADKLAAALPGGVVVRRTGGLFRRDRRVAEVEVTLGDWRFRLLAGADGLPRAERSHAVRGIALKSEAMELDEWVGALVQALSAHARSGAAAAEALRKLL